MQLGVSEDIDYTVFGDQFKKRKCCVIIPTYNNSSTIRQIILDVNKYTENIIVVNDGSTDETKGLLLDINNISVVHHPKNKGKGIALRTGFEQALKEGFEYAITIDSDGQHFAEDLPKFIAVLEKESDVLVVGARNMGQASVPKKSSFGNKFSNFWFKFETGIDLPDTQSGYRLYPIKLLQDIQFFTWKYEFEIEVLVRAAWKGIRVIPIPVKVYYAPKEARISHFRPFKDFTRIGLLNTALVIIALLYIKPVQLFKKIRQVGLKEFFRSLFNNANESNAKIAFSLSLGICMGIFPAWGFQMIIAVFLAIRFKLNKAIVLTAANISIPPMIPFILYFSYFTGGIVLNSSNTIKFQEDLSLTTFGKNFFEELGQYYIGAVCLSLLMGAVTGLITYLLLAIFRKEKMSSYTPVK